MDAAAPDTTISPRGAARLLSHCARLARGTDDRPTARARLEGELGLEMARLLVGALASSPGRTLPSR